MASRFRPERLPFPGAQPRRPHRGDPGALERYLRDLGDRPTLTPEAERRLATEVQDHARERRETLCSIPLAADLVAARWRSMRAEGRAARTLTENAGGDASARVDASMEQVISLLEQRNGSNGHDRAGCDETLRDALLAIEPAERLLDDLLRELEARRGRARRDAAARRELGMPLREFDARLRRARRAHEDLVRTRNAFVEHNLKLVLRLASEFTGWGVPLPDLIQEANLGLMRAVEKFDPGRGFKFSTYAVWWIRQALIRAVQRHSRTVRVPSHVYQLGVRFDRVTRELRGTLGRDPEPWEVGRAMGLDAERTEHLVRSRQPTVSLDVPRGDEEDEPPLARRLPEPSGGMPAMDQERIRPAVRELLRELPAREQQILGHRFGLDDEDPETLERIGRRLGLSRERVRQIEGQALARLREAAEARGLAGLIDTRLEPPRPSRSAA